MGQVFSDRMDELVEARASEMMDAPAENSEESADETTEEAPEETVEEAQEETTEAVAEEVEIGYSDSVLDRIVKENSIEDVEAFVEFAKDYDKDENNYLKAGELEKAAADWTAKASESEAPAEEEVAEPAPPSTWGDDVDPWQN